MFEKISIQEMQPKHVQVSKAISRLVAAHELSPGSELPGEQKLAERFGVSIDTIRKAKKTLIEQGILCSVSRQKTYVSEDALSARVAIIYDRDLLADPEANFMRLVINRLEGQGYPDITFQHYYWHQEHLNRREYAYQIISKAKSARVRALLLWNEQSEEMQEVFENGEIQTLALYSPPMQSPFVMHDRNKPIELGVDYLIEQGIREIALICSTATRSETVDQGAMFFEDYCRKRGLRVVPEWLGTNCPIAFSEINSFARFGYEQFKYIWEHPKKPKGVLVLDDIMLQGAVFAMREVGAEPGSDFQIVSHFNKDSRLFIPVPFARIEYNPSEYADAILVALGELLSCGELPKSVVCLQPKLVTEQASLLRE